MKAEPLLTVAIPTRNSRPYFDKCLESVLRELSTVDELDVELVIVDNASTDGSFELAAQISTPQQIRVFSNSTDEGPDYSVTRLAKLAAGKYIWFLGSQEILQLGSLPRILAKLRESDCDSMLLNFAVYAEAQGAIVSESQYDRAADQIYTSRLKYFWELGGPALAMSANIFRRTSYLHALSTPLCARNWGLYERALTCVINGSTAWTCLYVATPTFVLFQESNGWWTTGAVYLNFVQLLSVLNTRLRSHPILHFVLFRRQVGKPLRESIRAGKNIGLDFDKEVVGATIRECKFSASFWVFAFPMLLAPERIIRLSTRMSPKR